MAKKKKPKQPYLLAIFLACAPACATFGVLKEQVVPTVVSAVSIAGPGLINAAMSDVFMILGFPVEQAEKLLGLDKPAPEPGTPQ